MDRITRQDIESRGYEWPKAQPQRPTKWEADQWYEQQRLQNEWVDYKKESQSRHKREREISPIGDRWVKWNNYQIIDVKEPQSYIPFSSSANAMKTERYIVPKYDNNNHSRVYDPVPDTPKKTRAGVQENLKDRDVLFDWQDSMRVAEDPTDRNIRWFVHKYGLLGLLHHNVQFISNCDRLGFVGWIGENNIRKFQAFRQTYTKVGTAWSSHVTQLTPIYLEDSHINEDGIYATQDLPWKAEERHVGKSAYIVKYRDPFNRIPIEVPIWEGLAQYFPNYERHVLPDPLINRLEQRLIPQPNGGAFWMMYGERVSEFVNTLQGIQKLKDDILNQGDVETSTAKLNAIASDAQFVLITDESVNKLRIGFSSLLGLIAHQCIQYLAGSHKGVYTCINPECQVAFIRQYPGQEYHNKYCRKRHNNQKYKAKQS